VALSYAIAESSKILANSEPIPFDKSFKILVLEELLHFSYRCRFAIKTMGKMTPAQLVTGGLAVGIAGVIALSSQLLH
jgi:hypothetical protein